MSKSRIIDGVSTKLLLNPKILTVAILLVLSLGVGLAQPQEVLAQSTNQACQAIGGCDSGESDFQRILELVVNIFSVVIGIVAVIMIMVGGYKYITSGGDSSKIASAKSTLIYAVIGLVIVALAQIIVNFVLSNLISDD